MRPFSVWCRHSIGVATNSARVQAGATCAFYPLFVETHLGKTTFLKIERILIAKATD